MSREYFVLLATPRVLSAIASTRQRCSSADLYSKDSNLPSLTGLQYRRYFEHSLLQIIFHLAGEGRSQKRQQEERYYYLKFIRLALEIKFLMITFPKVYH